MKRWLVLALLAVTAPGTMRAQATGRITGTVTAEGGRPVSGASVQVVGTRLGTTTSDSGRFTIGAVPAGAYQVQARRIGFTSATQPVSVAAGQTATVSFELTASAVQLAGVVTVGYGTQSRRDVTGAVSSIKSENITQVISANPADAIKGRLPGVDVTTTSGEPGAAANIRIRGTRSITASNAPLFVVDGVPITGDLRDFDPNSIESIEVLKDAAAAATYGSRGANGVLLVTTKKGRAGRTQFSFNGSLGASSILRRADMMNAQQFADFRRESYRAAGNAACVNYLADPTACDAVALDATMRSNLAAGVDTDWEDEMLRSGKLQNYQLAAAGGTDNTRFRASVGYLDQTGIAITQAYNAKTASISVTHDFGRLDLQASAQGAQTLRNAGRGGGIWDEALFNAPLGRVHDDQGNLVFLPTEDGLRVNPVVDAENNDRDLERTNFLGTLSASYELLRGLRAVVNFGPQYSSVSDGWFVGTFTRENRGAGLPFAGLDNTTQRSYTLSNYLQLDREFGEDHRVQGTLLYEIANSRITYDSAASRNLPYPQQLWYNLGSGTGYNVRSQLTEQALQSYMARVNYTLKDRYTFTLLGRIDGSSVLAEDNKYGFFPAAAFAWQLGEEPFMQGASAFSDLKMRVSAGRTGSSAIAPYQTQGSLSQVWYTYGAQTPTALGFQPGALPNPNLEWETTDKYNIGLDFGLFEQRISGSVDAYLENTDNLLLTRALPYTTGFPSILENVGATQNKGFELSLTTVNLKGGDRKLEWSTDLNFAMNRNKIKRLASGLSADVGNLRFVGEPISVNYDYKFIGIWQTDEADAAKAMGFKPGDVKVADLSGDGKITADDRTFIGNHYDFPDWQGSMNNRFRYRGVDLTVLLTARWGYTVNTPFITAYTNLIGRFNNRAVNYWTPENPSNEYPRPSTLGVGNYYPSVAYVDGSHVRIRDITVGYELPSVLASRINAGRARLYLKAQDPFLFTDFVGWDPESGYTTGNPNSTASQIDVGGPTYRTFLFGLDINF